MSRIWRAFGLQPHWQDSWKLSKDPQFVDKVHDVVGLYLNPPEAAVVLCVDEKSQIQALDRTAPVLQMLPGTPALVVRPSAAASTILDRTANAFAEVARLDHAVNWERCSSVKATAGATGSAWAHTTQLARN